jgi:hypothetical protein
MVDGTEHHSLIFNTEAGTHPLPVDNREIEAVSRAGLRCYQEHPYFLERYGERGKAFTRSDGGYLATLADHPQSHVDGQVTWLARVLANRGIPRWLMEVHLDLLVEELTAAVPDRAVEYFKLHNAAQVLREERLAVISESGFHALVAAFDSASGEGIKGAGGLLVAAVCDECCGLVEAVPSLVGWLGSPTRFSSKWCVAITGTLTQARRLAAQSRGDAP